MDAEERRLVVLGCTGSIGQQTLAVVRSLQAEGARLRIIGLSAYSDAAGLAAACAEFDPDWAVLGPPGVAQLADQGPAPLGRTALYQETTVLEELLQDPQITHVMAAMVGFAGVSSTLAALRAGKTVLLANKEVMVTAGALVQELLKEVPGARLIPVDSEHQAVFQCVGGEMEAQRSCIQNIILTASGGPFRDKALWSIDRLEQVSPAQALAHPRWSMGPKISIDSATMMNKGLEVIEAHFLFSLPPEQCAIWVHPESVVHALVQYQDGSILANMSVPSMLVPIAQALTWPDRIYRHGRLLNLLDYAALHFEEPDRVRFPCLDHAHQALMSGHAALIVLNAANECAVAAFLAEKLGFLDIGRMIEQALGYFEKKAYDKVLRGVEDIISLDQEVRRYCVGQLKNIPVRVY